MGTHSGMTPACQQAGEKKRPTRPPLSESGFQSALSALLAMAILSLRRQADLDIALKRAGLILSPEHRTELLERLALHSTISGIVRLEDGGILISFSSLG